MHYENYLGGNRKKLQVNKDNYYISINLQDKCAHEQLITGPLKEWLSKERGEPSGNERTEEN